MSSAGWRGASKPARLVHRTCSPILISLLMAGCTHESGTAGTARTPSQIAPPAGITGMQAGDRLSITAYHNQVRAEVGVAPLQWSASLAAYAQAWADHLAATSCNMRHRADGRYGENLFQGTAGHYTARDAAQAWESEKQNYHAGMLTESNWHAAGHYTQMVWRATRAFGCGESQCADTLIVVCNYDPPGNYIGRRPY